MSTSDREAGRIDGLREAAAYANELLSLAREPGHIAKGGRRMARRIVTGINDIIVLNGGQPIDLYEGTLDLSGVRRDRDGKVGG